MSRPRTPIICPGCGSEMDRTSAKPYSSDDSDSWHVCPQCGGCGRLRAVRRVTMEWIHWQKPLAMKQETPN